MFVNVKKNIKHSLGLDTQPLPQFSVEANIKQTFTDFSNEDGHFNIFLPTVRASSIFGGIYTALLFLNSLQRNHCQVRITTFDHSLSDSEKTETSAFMKASLGLSVSISNISTISEFMSSQPSKSDVFIATIWYTATRIRKILRENAFKHQRFIYFIQDFEPGFSQWSDNYAEALTTYKKGEFLPVFNSTLLKDYFVNNRILVLDQYFVIKPQIQTENLTLPSKLNTTKRVVFYARPTRPRNLFKTGLQGLIDWLQEYSPDVEVTTVGQPHKAIEFDKWTIKSLGKMSADEYWNTLSSYDIGLSLMLSPHPSYPPLEMAMSGVVTVTNKYENKDMELFTNNIVSCDIDPESIKESLQEAYKRANDLESRIKNATFEFDREGVDMETVALGVKKAFA